MKNCVAKFIIGRLQYVGKAFLKLEEEKCRTLILTMLEAGLLEFFFLQHLEHYASRSLESMLNKSGAEEWMKIKEMLRENRAQGRIAAALDVSTWDDIPGPVMAAPILEAYLERCADQNPDRRTDWYQKGMAIMRTWLWAGKTEVHGPDGIDAIEHKGGNASGKRICAVLNTALLECIDRGIELSLGITRRFKTGLGDDLLKIMLIKAFIQWLDRFLECGLGHPEKGLAARTAAILANNQWSIWLLH